LRASAAGGSGRRLEHPPQDFEVAILDLGEASKRSTVGRQRIRGHPAAAGELVEVDAGLNLAVERADVDPPRQCWIPVTAL